MVALTGLNWERKMFDKEELIGAFISVVLVSAMVVWFYVVLTTY